VLPLFCGVRSLAQSRRAAVGIGSRKGLIFDSAYHFWQAKRTR